MPFLNFISSSKFCLLTVGTLKNAANAGWLVKLICLALAYMEPIKNMYHLVVGTILINFMIGIYKNRKLYQEHFKSKKAWKTIEKLGLFTIYVSFIFLFETIILTSGEAYVSRILCGILILSEAKSISENGDAILNIKIFTPFYRRLFNLFSKSKAS